jgi:hypothetical protein
MKTNVLTLALVLMTLTANAQQKAKTLSVTPKAGVTASSFSGKMPATISYVIVPVDGGIDELRPVDESKLIRVGAMSFGDIKNKVGFTIGVEGQYQFTSVVGLSLGVFYTQEGATYNTKGCLSNSDGVKFSIKDDLKIHLNCITVPVLANVYVWKGLALKAGLQPEFAIEKKTKGDVTMEFEGTVFKAMSSDADIKSFSLSLPIGISYEYKHVVADLRYSFGLTDLHKNKDAGIGGYSFAHNRVLTFTLGYKFP